MLYAILDAVVDGYGPVVAWLTSRILRWSVVHEMGFVLASGMPTARTS